MGEGFSNPMSCIAFKIVGSTPRSSNRINVAITFQPILILIKLNAGTRGATRVLLHALVSSPLGQSAATASQLFLSRGRRGRHTPARQVCLPRDQDPRPPSHRCRSRWKYGLVIFLPAIAPSVR